MSEVEVVALWVGLLAGVASIVLAIVALTFTVSVEKRSRDVSDQMIRSLQKIESTVERSSGDTVDLIKVAWERLLGNVTGTGSAQDAAQDAERNVKEIVAGVVAELKADLAQQHTEGQASEPEILKRVDELVSRLESSLGSSSSAPSEPPPDRLMAASRLVEGLTPRARELVRQLFAGGHLTRAQYRSLREPENGLRSELSELRYRGVIGPLSGKSETGEVEPVYWFAPGLARYMRTALEFNAADRDVFAAEVAANLARVGYPQRWLADPSHRRPSDAE